MSDDLATLLPTASMTAATFGLWLTATREGVRKAIDAEYDRNKDPKRDVRTELLLVWSSALIPIAVVTILFSTVKKIVTQIDGSADFSPSRAFLVVVGVLWVYLLIWSACDLCRVQVNACSVRKARRIFKSPPPDAAKA